jgi:hypothetical protein
MRIKPCPNCGRLPKIEEGCRRANGNRFYTIGCPNYCWVLKPQKLEDNWRYVSWLSIEGDVDYNTMYKKWNEELVEVKGDIETNA